MSKYNEAANELTNNGFTFDANGSMTADPGVFSSASYNVLDQASSVTPTGQSALSQTYAGLGQAQRLSAGSTGYVTANFGIDSESAASSVYFTDDPGGASLGERVGSSAYYFLHDALGSVVAVTDASGNLVVKYGYDRYGSVTSTAGHPAHAACRAGPPAASERSRL